MRAVGLVEGDHQVAVAVGGRVVRIVGVVLQLLVAPAVLAVGGDVADLVGPVGRVRRGARRLVELVAPGQAPAGRAGIGSAVVLERDRDIFAATRPVIPEVERLGAGPVLAEGEVAAEGGVGAAGRDRLAVEGRAVERHDIGVAGQASFVEPEVEHEVVQAVAVHILHVALRHAGLLVDMGLRTRLRA